MLTLLLFNCFGVSMGFDSNQSFTEGVFSGFAVCAKDTAIRVVDIAKMMCGTRYRYYRWLMVPVVDCRTNSWDKVKRVLIM